MNKIILTAFTLALASTGMSQNTPITPPGQMAPTPTVAQTPDPAMVQFTETEFNFGKIKQNVPVSHVFTMKNVGSRDIELINVSVSCGCTTPNWRGGKYKPGESTAITATYDAKSEGAFHKVVTVLTSEGAHTIILKGEVLNDMAYADYQKQKHIEDSTRQAAEKANKKAPKKDKKSKKTKGVNSQPASEGDKKNSSAINRDPKSKRN